MMSTAPASSGKPKWNASSTACRIRLVEHLQRRRHDAGADDVADGLGRVVDRLEDAEQRAIRLRVARDAHPDLRDDAERPLGADDHAGQVVAGVVLGRAAGLDDAAVGQDELDAEDVVDGDAVLERVRAAGVGGDVAADRAGALARRVGGVVEAVRLEVVGQPEVDDARLDDGVAVAIVDFEDPLHPRQAIMTPPPTGRQPPARLVPAPRGTNGTSSSLQSLTICDDLLGRGREDDDVGLVLLDGVAVALVDEQFAGRGEDAVGADDGTQTVAKANHWVHHKYGGKRRHSMPPMRAIRVNALPVLVRRREPWLRNAA